MSKVWKIAARLLLALLPFLVTGCSGVRKIKDIQVKSVGVKYITPTSQRSAEGVLLLEIDNPAMGFTLSDVDGTIKLQNREMGTFTAGELPLQARSIQVYELPCTATLSESVSLLEVLTLISRRSLEGFTADIRLHAKLHRQVRRIRKDRRLVLFHNRKQTMHIRLFGDGSRQIPLTVKDSKPGTQPVIRPRDILRLNT